MQRRGDCEQLVKRVSGKQLAYSMQAGGQAAGRVTSSSTCNPLRHNPLIFALHEATQQVIGQHAQVRLRPSQLVVRLYVGKVQVTCISAKHPVAMTTASAASAGRVTMATRGVTIRLRGCLTLRVTMPRSYYNTVEGVGGIPLSHRNYSLHWYKPQSVTHDLCDARPIGLFSRPQIIIIIIIIII